MRRSSLGLVGFSMVVVCFAVACAAGGGSGEPDGSTGPGSTPGSSHDASGAPSTKDAQATADATGPADAGALDAATADEPDAGPPEPLVYGHSPDTLYSYDVATSTVTEIGAFAGCTQSTLTEVIDLAVDSKGNAYATTFDGFYSVDLATAQCSLVKAGSYPNSLSFVPAGTLDPNVEALVGYSGSAYVRIDPSTGDVTSVGALGDGYASSGDIVSVEGGGTFLTVTGNGCGDCLLQVDPSTGDYLHSYGALPHAAVYGLAYWAGSLYGFDAAGDLFSIGDDGQGGIATTDVVVDGGVVWWGAGSTTAAPATSPDGGAIPTQ
jgi:hypothetical protein